MARTKLSTEDLRERLVICLSLAPRLWFRALWEPKTPRPQREAVRAELVAFLIQGWDTHDIGAATTQDTRGHSVPSASPDVV